MSQAASQDRETIIRYASCLLETCAALIALANEREPGEPMRLRYTEEAARCLSEAKELIRAVALDTHAAG